MVINKGEYQSLELQNSTSAINRSVSANNDLLTGDNISQTKFYGTYQDCMEIYASLDQVESYFNAHALWFSRCAEPMKVSALSENSYALVVGKFGAFGYDVEPKIGLELSAPQDREYHIRSISLPDYQAPGYEVDYKSLTRLIDDVDGITRVEWELYLVVELHFPKFIQRLPRTLIQSTGDRILNEIVHQISRRLTRKVKKDFYQSLNIPFPPSKHK
ncbi:DUF1997 domain-containing protein [Dolichospermum sp. FACHB-1091]|uniref:DUF1997 domain-containing protein n=1 Tax=Dolichospermum sp. FACHB-1091 TaxID=2692798 RepID=UPI001680C628|nr:DUF1997 domain-containing protein [Dolichospermum sp. FACHB-1091]MBD2442237.1 DUF1997 domain-containing protein [Dolichospermum sp. FACHB-1091]